MKKKYFLAILFLSTIIIYSCKKNGVQIIDAPAINGAQVKFFNFGMNSPSINFYANDAKVSATLSATGAESTTGVTYGSVFPASNYVLLPAGSVTIKGQIPSTAVTDANLSTVNLTTSLEVDKYYSVYTCGFYNTTAKTSDAFIIEDKLPAVDTSASYMRFVNTIPNISYASFSIRNTTTLVETVIATNMLYKTGSDFIKIPQAVYDLIIRYPNPTTGSQAVGITRLAYSALKGRVVTITTRGDITITSTTLVNRPSLDATANR